MHYQQGETRTKIVEKLVLVRQVAFFTTFSIFDGLSSFLEYLKVIEPSEKSDINLLEFSAKTFHPENIKLYSRENDDNNFQTTNFVILLTFYHHFIIFIYDFWFFISMYKLMRYNLQIIFLQISSSFKSSFSEW